MHPPLNQPHSLLGLPCFWPLASVPLYNPLLGPRCHLVVSPTAPALKCGTLPFAFVAHTILLPHQSLSLTLWLPRVPCLLPIFLACQPSCFLSLSNWFRLHGNHLTDPSHAPLHFLTPGPPRVPALLIPTHEHFPPEIPALECLSSCRGRKVIITVSRSSWMLGALVGRLS